MAAKHPDDDLFKDSTMSFGEHLEELRARLVLAIIGIAIGFVIGLIVARPVVGLIQSPFQEALGEYYQNEALEKYERWLAEKREEGLTVPDDSEQVKYMVMQRGMLYEEMHVEPRELVGSLRKLYPGTFPDVDLVGPTNFRESDFLEPLAIVEQLTDAAAAEEDSPAKRIWQRLGAEQQEKLASAETPEEAREALTSALDGMLDGEVPYDLSDLSEDEDSEFHLPIFGETRELLQREASGNLTDREHARLNRLLVETALRGDDALKLTQPQLVTMFSWHPLSEDDRVKLTTLNAHEGFMIFIKAALITGLVISSPWVFLQIWLFVAAGLYPHEKHYVYVFLPFSLFLFLFGAAFAFLFVFGPVLRFLLGFNNLLGIDPDPRISEWLSFVIFLPLGFGVSFQLPLVMLFLQRIGVFTVESYTSKWRIAALVIAVLAMILTPADPTSMMMMAIPLWFLYAGGILLCKYLPKSRSPFAEPAEAVV